MISFDDAVSELRRDVRVAPEALERCEIILELQHAALAADPPMARLPDAARLAALARVRSGEPVIPRERMPIETARAARLLRVLGDQLAPQTSLHAAAPDFVEQAMPAVLADDGESVARTAELLDLPVDASLALLREALKPEMLRTTFALSAFLEHAPRARRCPTCGERPCAASRAGSIACCEWCGTTWAWDSTACASCGESGVAKRELTKVLRDALLVQCASCGWVVPAFPCSPDPLLLSLHAVLIGPIVLALRIESRSTPYMGFSLF